MRSEDLRYFLAVAGAGKLGPASDLLGITQPGLTKAIGRLESELGGPLFRRTGRGMELTDLGISFQDRARRVRDELNHAMAEARALNPQEGVIRLGIASQLQPLAMDLCARFVRQRPLVRFEMMLQISDYLELGLSSGRIDLALASESRLFPQELSFQPLASAGVRIYAGSDHPLAGAARPLALSDLVGHDWALPSSDTALRRHLAQAFRDAGLPAPVARIENEDCSAILPLIAACGLLTLCAEYAYGEVAAGSVLALPVSDFHWKRRVGLLTRRNFPLTPVAADFRQQLMECRLSGPVFDTTATAA